MGGGLPVFSPYHALPWDEYLAARWQVEAQEEGAAHITGALRSVGERIAGSMERDSALRRESAAMLAVSMLDIRARLADISVIGLDAVGRLDDIWCTLRDGFDLVHSDLGEIHSSLERMQAAYRHGLALQLEQAVLQNQTSAQIAATLERMEEAGKTEMQTRAREQFLIACEQWRRGLLKEAVKFFEASIKIFDADFSAHFQLGKLRLYGVNETDKVIDLKEAKKHLAYAVRLGKGAAKTTEDMQGPTAEALFHLSVANYAMASEMERKGSPHEEYLKEGAACAEEATERNPQLAEAYYQAAKCFALLRRMNGPDDDDSNVHCTENVERAIWLDRKYLAKVVMDPDFASEEEPWEPAIDSVGWDEEGSYSTLTEDLASTMEMIREQARKTVQAYQERMQAMVQAELSEKSDHVDPIELAALLCAYEEMRGVGASLGLCRGPLETIAGKIGAKDLSVMETWERAGDDYNNVVKKMRYNSGSGLEMHKAIRLAQALQAAINEEEKIRSAQVASMQAVVEKARAMIEDGTCFTLLEIAQLEQEEEESVRPKHQVFMARNKKVGQIVQCFGQQIAPIRECIETYERDLQDHFEKEAQSHANYQEMMETAQSLHQERERLKARFFLWRPEEKINEIEEKIRTLGKKVGREQCYPPDPKRYKHKTVQEWRADVEKAIQGK